MLWPHPFPWRLQTPGIPDNGLLQVVPFPNAREIHTADVDFERRADVHRFPSLRARGQYGFHELRRLRSLRQGSLFWNLADGAERMVAHAKTRNSLSMVSGCSSMGLGFTRRKDWRAFSALEDPDSSPCRPSAGFISSGKVHPFGRRTVSGSRKSVGMGRHLLRSERRDREALIEVVTDAGEGIREGHRPLGCNLRSAIIASRVRRVRRKIILLF